MDQQEKNRHTISVNNLLAMEEFSEVGYRKITNVRNKSPNLEGFFLYWFSVVFV